MTPGDLVKGSVRLISLPDVYLKVSQVLDNPASSMADIGRVISQDPALAARLLKIANSPFYGFPSRIDTIPRAVTVIGSDGLRELVLIASVSDIFTRMADKFIDMQIFWQHSTYCAIAARVLALQCGVLSADALFVAGLLHDVGQLLILSKVPEMARGAYLRAMDADLRLCDVEQEVLGFDHAQVGGELLRSWALPESLCDAIEHHHEPAQARHAPIGAALVNIANSLARRAHPLRTAQDSTASPEAQPLDLDEYSLKVTGLTLKMVEQLVPDIAAQALDLVRILLPKAA